MKSTGLFQLSLKQGMGNRGIGESGNLELITDKTGILVCLLIGKRICYFVWNNTDDEHTVYTAGQLSYYIAYAYDILYMYYIIYM